ncbi:MAG: CaiB/BaiF CoA-transferase family protein [Rhodobacterales bacterium]|nr:CaiB/BaiF CoA-transferase family protein [Rhodobacterales bacterium]
MDVTGALDGITILDLTRILAGPTCTQLLGDLGADVIKIENPAGGGDDTRAWGPPYVMGSDGEPTDLSAYFMSSNRNKRSVAVDIASAEGQATIRALATKADVVIENFKPGGLAKYGLDHESMLKAQPGLVYCSISGFGQTGPHAAKPGYDLMAQGFGGIMSLTGEPEGMPMKVGVAVADVVCGMYATVGILAALRHRERTGEGQYIDVALVDTQIAWLINEGANYLASGKVPVRRGNGHPNIVPYQVFAALDGHVIVAVGNDGQFRRCCEALGVGGLADVPDYATNPARAVNREALLATLTPLFRARPMAEVIAVMEAAGVPVGPVNRIDQALASDQVAAREMVIEMARPDVAGGVVRLLGNPLKLTRTPVSYRRAPPRCGEDTVEVLGALALLGPRDFA